MALVNHAKFEINAKLVFFGPGHSGKATNLNYIYRKLKPEHRGKLKTSSIGKDRMLFFDFAPSGQGKIGAYNVRFHIYSITGDAAATSWKMVLKGADGVVFVADSAAERLEANRNSLNDLQKALGSYCKSIAELPGVLQCNKRDLPASLPVEEMQKALNPGRFPVIPASAGKGEGVLESLYSLMKSVLRDLREKGLEMDREPEQLASAAMTDGGRENMRGMESAVCSTAPVFVAGGDADTTLSPFSSGMEDENGVSIKMTGEPEILAGGGLRLPLSLKYGEIEKKFSLTVAVCVEPDQAL